MFDKKNLIFIGLLVALLAFLLIQNSMENSAARKIDSEIEVITGEYRLEKKKLEAELEELKATFGDRVAGGSRLMLVFTDFSVDFMEEVHSNLKDKGIKATIAFTKDTVPGFNSNLSTEEFQILLNDGWQAALYWDGANSFPFWYEETKEFLTGAGVAMPKVILIDEKNNKRANNDYFLEYGFNDVVVRREEFDFNEKFEDLIHSVNAVGWYSTTAAKTLTTIGKENHEAAFIVGGDNPNEAFNLAQFNAMMDKVEKSIKEGFTDVTTFDGARELRETIEIRYQEELDKFNEEVRVIEDEIARYDQLIKDAYNNYQNGDR